MSGRILTNLVVLSLVMASCGQVAVKPENLPDLVTDHIITAYNHYYPGSTVELSIKLSMTPQEIWFGGNWNLVKSSNPPIDGIWKDKLTLEKKNIGEMAITMVLNLNDGTKKKLSKSITVVNKPQINIEQARSSKTGDKLIVWADAELSKVEYIDLNGKTTPFEKKDKEFTLEQKLPDPGKPAGTIRTTDTLGVVEDKLIKAAGIDEPKIYYTNGIRIQYDDAEKTGIYFIKEAPLDMSYEKTIFKIRHKQVKYELQKIPCVAAQPNLNLDSVHEIRLTALSKDKRIAIFTSDYYTTAEDNYMENGHLMINVFVIFTFAYNTQTGEQKLIAKMEESWYKDYKKTVGSQLFPVFIDDKEILFVEQLRDGKLYNISNVKSGSLLCGPDNPHATARAVSLSLDDLVLRPTDKVKPLSPWVSYADMNTGIIGYTSPDEKWRFKNNSLPDTFNNTGVTKFISDLKGTKVVRIDELCDRMMAYSEKDYIDFEDVNIVTTFKDMTTTNLYFISTFSKHFNGKVEWEGPGEPDWRIKRVFRYNFISGQLDQIDCKNITVDNRKTFYGKSILSSFDLKYPYLLLHTNSFAMPFVIKDNKIIKIDTIIGMNNATRVENILILPGGEQ